MNWKNEKLKDLARAFSVIKNPHNIAIFLRDLCTLDELEEMSNRWQAVLLLNQGKTYREIAKKTGLSTTTVTRIAYWLEHGEGGYKAALHGRDEAMPRLYKKLKK